MPEVLVEFDTILTTRDGRAYRPQACGRAEPSGVWEGWLEFLPVAGGSPVRSGRETEQPNRADLKYWAEGLTQVYLEGALNRALASPTPPAPPSVPVESAFDGPRPAPAPGAAVPLPQPVLDPFEVYAQGVDRLRQQLDALDVAHLRSIVLAYGFAPNREADAAPRDVLTRMVIDGARAAAESRST